MKEFIQKRIAINNAFGFSPADIVSLYHIYCKSNNKEKSDEELQEVFTPLFIDQGAKIKI